MRSIFKIRITTRLTALKALPLVALLLLASCNKELLENQCGEGGDLIAINLNVGISGSAQQTRAAITETTFPSTSGTVSNLGLFYTKEDGTTPYTTGADNMLMQLKGNGTGVTTNYSYNNGSTFVDKLYFRTNETVKLYGYYPRTTAAGVTATAIPIDLTTAAEQADQTDLLYAAETITKSNVATATLQFKHAYALLEFQVKKKSPKEAQFTSIEVKNKTGFNWLANKGAFNLKTSTFDPTQYGNVTVKYTTDNTLLESSYTTFWVMVPPFTALTSAGDGIEVQFHEETNTPKPFVIKADYLKIDGTDKQGFQSGAKYTFKLLYNNVVGTAKADFNLIAWESSGGEISGDIGYNPPPSTIMEYGGTNGSITTGLKGSTTESYNALYGEGITTNGAYQTSAANAYANEKPYYKLEIAKTDAYKASGGENWRTLQGTTKDNNICVTTHGAGWRLPRLSELRMMYLNKDALKASSSDFVQFVSNYYWSSSEYDSFDSWYVHFISGATGSYYKTSNYRVRCVREVTP